jgi:small-conductance mechanosensitive channel
MIARKAVTYTGFFLVLMAVLGELGVKLTALLGAAGIVGIAVGFASQTSVSNIISGLFLISEKPFAIGDVIKIGSTTGIIQSIDLLSVKIRTFDNTFVRIPNEKILSSEVTNITRFPIRRMDITFQVSYEENLDRVREVLGDIARANPWCLDEPAPVVVLSDFKDSGIDVLFGLWFAKADFLDLKNSIMQDILARFRAEGISIPYPHRELIVKEKAGRGVRPARAGIRSRARRPGRAVTS